MVIKKGDNRAPDPSPSGTKTKISLKGYVENDYDAPYSGSDTNKGKMSRSGYVENDNAAPDPSPKTMKGYEPMVGYHEESGDEIPNSSRYPAKERRVNLTYEPGGQGPTDAGADYYNSGAVEGKIRRQGVGAGGGGGNAVDHDPAPTEGNNVIAYQGDENYQDPVERESIVEGYGPYGIRPLEGDTDSELKGSGFLKRNNVRDRQ